MKLRLPGDTKSDLGLTGKINFNPVKYLAMKQQFLDCKASFCSGNCNLKDRLYKALNTTSGSQKIVFSNPRTLA